LHVVRIIAEHHGGTVMAINLEDRSGVAFVIRLPLVEPIALTGTQAVVKTEPLLRV
jgi:K+-sensing histidine kinase KdpD